MANDFDIRRLLREEPDFGKVIGVLQNGRLTPMPDFEHYERQLDPEKHDVMDPVKRPNKLINVDPDSPEYGATRNVFVNSQDEDKGREKTKIERVNRIALAWQRLIVKRAVGITFGNKVKYKAQPETDQEEALFKAVKRVLIDVKEQTLNRKIARQIYGMTECAERWYTTMGSEPHTNYSPKGTTLKIRCVVFSPMFGDTLYPYFDDDHDLAAFSRRFLKTMDDGHKRTFFETYTDDTFYMWQTDSDSGADGWELCEGYPMRNPFGKIPVIYGCQPEPDYAEVETLIARMETLLSNFGDTNDYHGSPKIIAKGHINSFCKKGEAGGILEVDPDAEVNYLSWDHAPESVKTEYLTLKELIHALSQTPDISWDSVKGMNVSGVALELMFMDAILKVKDKEEVWADYLLRRVNLLKAILAKIDSDLFEEAAKTLLITPELDPYVVVDRQQRANVELSLAGNKQLKSQRTAMVDAGIENPDEELEAIKGEEQVQMMFEQSEPTMA